MSPTALIGLLLGLALSASVLLLLAALQGWTPRRTRTSQTGTRAAAPSGSGDSRRRALIALGAGLIVAAMTRWPVAAGAAMGLIYLWPSMFGGARLAAGQVERIEALATWTESLRDSIAGSIGLEEAIRHSLHAAPPILQPPLQRLEGRIRAQIPLPHALAGYAEEFEDSSADLVVAALILNSRLRGPGLVATLSALSSAAREEIDMRHRIEEGRKSLRRTATIIIAVTALFAGALTLFSRDYVAPYSTPFGQAMLAIVLAVFAGGLIWIRSAANIRPPGRFLVGIDQIDAALQPAATLRPSSRPQPSTAGSPTSTTAAQEVGR